MEPRLLGDVLKKFIKSKPIGKSLAGASVLKEWDNIVSPPINKFARPVGIKDNKLLVEVNSSPWLNELTFLKEDIRTKLNHKIGREVIKDIKFFLKEEVDG